MSRIQQLFGKKLRELRRKRDITQEKLAELSGLSLQYIGEIERNRRNPSLTSMESLAEALDIPIGELFNLEEFQRSDKELRETLIRQIQQADPERLRLFYELSRVAFK